MNRRGGGKPASGNDIADLVVHNRGRKGMRSADLADRYGVTTEQMSRLLGPKLRLLPRNSWFELRGQGRARPVTVLRLNAIIMISAWVGTDRALEAASVIAPLLKTRLRASKNKQRRPRRRNDPPRQTRYQEAFLRLQIEVRKLEKKLQKELREISRTGSGPGSSASRA